MSELLHHLGTFFLGTAAALVFLFWLMIRPLKDERALAMMLAGVIASVPILLAWLSYYAASTVA